MKSVSLCLALMFCMVVASSAVASQSPEVGGTYGEDAQFQMTPNDPETEGCGCITIQGGADNSLVEAFVWGQPFDGVRKKIVRNKFALKKGDHVTGSFGIVSNIRVEFGQIKVTSYHRTGGGCANHFHLRN